MGEAGKTAEEVLTWDDGQCYDIAFAIGKSRRYHAIMRDFYQWWHYVVLASTAVTGSAAFVSLIGSNPNTPLATVLTGIVGVASTFDLVFGFQKRAEIHQGLCQRFTLLAAQLLESPASEKNRLRFCAERTRIEADEPSMLRLIDLRAHNEELFANGVPLDRLVPLSVLQRSPLAYLFNFGLDGIRERMAEREKEAAARE